MKVQIIKFLRREAHKFYMGLNYQQKRLITEQQIYREMKASWKAGNKLKQDARDKAGSSPINFKDLPEESKERILAGQAAKYAGNY